MEGSNEMLIDGLAPGPDATRSEHALVDGMPEQVYPRVLDADLLRAVSESRLVKMLFTARSLAERAASAAARRYFVEPPPPDTLRLSDMSDHGEWVLLGEDPPAEVAFGVVGRFWGGETVWETIDASDFAGFEQDGLAKIACNFSLRPYGSRKTLVSYEARTTVAGAADRTAFLRYWRMADPSVGIVMRSQLRVIAEAAASRPGSAPGD